jgi:hypothetical protein
MNLKNLEIFIKKWDISDIVKSWIINHELQLNLM